MKYSTHGDVFATRKGVVNQTDLMFKEDDRKYRILANGKKQYLL